MLAADSMLQTPWLRLGIPGVSWIRCPRAVDFVRLGFRPRSATLEPTTEARKADSLRWIACFKEPVAKGKKVEAEYVRGGEDLWDAASASQQGGYPEHLVVMVNGLVGSAEDWRFAAEQFVRRLPDKVLVHRSECNSLTLTFDGVDLMGERLAEEVLSVVKRRKGIRKISFVAHSLGGLVARYAVGRLYEPITTMESSLDTENHTDKSIGMEGRIAGLEPMNFITFASPHLGSRGHKQLPFLCGLPFLERRASETAHFIVGRTGKHLFLTDNDDGKPPLLLRMVDDCDDIKFRSALRSFKRRVAYANANFDHMVGWRTSSIRRQRELPKHHLLLDDNKYPHIVFVDKGDKINNLNETSTVAEAIKDELEEKMIRGLTQVSWERVDVSFQKSRQRYIAHNTIQVKSYWLNSDGADVIFHMIDNFII
uniref:DUF676 domain-containing protein n=1 Tax=Musa acuminata subsp. malaccensis TaxID=214687 RepID=A0A804KJ31_MUSAM|nr:PREDICTED: uncharacterized protein LOC103997867 isoform X1 [Musa acuminata subsp. malaccensis]XP_009417472.1 PREDICTED: uncharacterized protein LOC103997867 isoform X1 [Musa acuminata subsp. malaccensis]